MDPHSTVRLHTGSRMPILGLGTWQLRIDTTATVEAALELGYRMIDTSGDYGTQAGIGAAIGRSGIARGSIYLVTKVEETDDAYAATRKNLEELQLEYADLMLIHRPPPSGAGEALWEGLMRAKEDGFAKDIGVSNYSVELIEALTGATGETPTVNQIEWTPFGHSEQMRRHCETHNILIQAYSPLTRTKRLGDKNLNVIAARYGKPPAQLMIRWNLQLGSVPLPKANQRRHLEEDIDLFDFEISNDDMVLLTGLNERFSSLGSLPYE